METMQGAQLRCGNGLIIDYPITVPKLFANETNKLLDNFGHYKSVQHHLKFRIKWPITMCYNGVFSMFTNSKHEYMQFNVDWVCPLKIKFLNFGDGILEQKGNSL